MNGASSSSSVFMAPPRFTASPQSLPSRLAIYISRPPRPPGLSELKKSVFPSAVMDTDGSRYDLVLMLRPIDLGRVQTLPFRLATYISPSPSSRYMNSWLPSGEIAMAASWVEPFIGLPRLMGWVYSFIRRVLE